MTLVPNFFSLIRQLDAQTTSGNVAVITNTVCGPTLSTNQPLRYAVITRPNAWAPQQRDCNAPSVAPGDARASSTTMESATTSEKAVAAAAAVMQAIVLGIDRANAARHSHESAVFAQGVMDHSPGPPKMVSVASCRVHHRITLCPNSCDVVCIQGYGEVAVIPAASVAQQQTPPQQIQQAACPFPAGELPLTPAEIGGDANMFSFYIHEAIPNCILWGLYNAGALHQTIQDGNIPQLRLITDLFGGLIPELPKHYPKKGMLMDIRMVEAPTVKFKAGSDGSVVISARYDTNVSVLNATGDGHTALVAQLTANVSIAADFGWTQTVIHGTTVNYAVVSQVFPVNANGWNQIIDWVVKQAGPKQSLGQLWDTYVKTPATPYVGLDNVAAHAVDSWFIVSSDVKVKQLPPVV